MCVSEPCMSVCERLTRVCVRMSDLLCVIQVMGCDEGWPILVCLHERCMSVCERLTRVCVKMSDLLCV